MMERNCTTTREQDADPEVYYLPGAENHYDYRYNVIVLDEELKEYPKAHDLILQHERGHATDAAKTFTGLLRHEFANDLDYYFGTGEAVEEVHDYYRNRDSGSLSMRTRAALAAGNVVRILWQPVLGSLALLRREL
ncbi:hypothetical protein [Halostella litorea]|uniref:hypothetical protein n=1 Tax=Halostella litorea TaxID=2528831 RepID=UPI001091CD3C|nr:hypothetical protein [Halostella litorea]